MPVANVWYIILSEFYLQCTTTRCKMYSVFMMREKRTFLAAFQIASTQTWSILFCLRIMLIDSLEIIPGCKKRVLRRKTIICTPSVCWNNVALVVAVECCRKEESSAWSICWDRVGVGNVLLIPLPTLLTGIRDYWGLEMLNCCWFGCRSSSLHKDAGCGFILILFKLFLCC